MVKPLRSLREFILRDLLHQKKASPLYFVKYAGYEVAVRECKTDDARPFHVILTKLIIFSHIHAPKYQP